MNSLVFSNPLQQRLCNVRPRLGRVIPFITVISILGFCVLCASRAQSPQLIAGPLDGQWININLGTIGLLKIDIHGTEVHPFGDCHPSPCDWGVATARGYAANVRSSEITALYLHRATNFNEVEIAINLENNGLLRVETLTHFTDSSHRADYFSVGYFERNRAPAKP